MIRAQHSEGQIDERREQNAEEVGRASMVVKTQDTRSVKGEPLCST